MSFWRWGHTHKKPSPTPISDNQYIYLKFTCVTISFMQVLKLIQFHSHGKNSPVWNTLGVGGSAYPFSTIVGFTRRAVSFKFHSWFRNLKLPLSFETTTKSYGKRNTLRAAGGPTRSLLTYSMNAQTLRFRQLELTSILFNHSALPARVCIFHALYDRASRGAYKCTLKYFRF